MKPIRIAVLALAAVFAFMPLANADSMNLSITGQTLGSDPFSVDLLLTYSSKTDVVSAVSGSFSTPGGSFSSSSFKVVPTGNAQASALFIYDNLLNPKAGATPGLMDWSGLLIEQGAYEFNLFSDGSNWYWADNGSYHSDNEVTKAPAAVTPEPGNLLLMGTGLLILAAIVFRAAAHSEPPSA